MKRKGTTKKGSPCQRDGGEEGWCYQHHPTEARPGGRPTVLTIEVQDRLRAIEKREVAERLRRARTEEGNDG